MTFKKCRRCLMNEKVPDFKILNDGYCNYCNEFFLNHQSILELNQEEKNLQLKELVKNCKINGENKKYDCVIGVSGGVDSSWTLVKAVELGLRPLVVHMDNSWNSELAQSNIANLINAIGVDLYTYVIDWDEYREIMQSFFEADVIDIELLYDNAMLAVIYKQASKYGIKHILAGTNRATEGMRMPPGWSWYKLDERNIRDLASKRKIKLKTFPSIGLLKYLYFEYFKKIRWISFLDFLDYDKLYAIKILKEKYNYKPYPYKHYESIFTRFYQGYILPEKFEVDKRLVHLSSLILTGKISRDEALKDIQKLAYSSENDLNEDKKYFLKKMNWTQQDFENYLSRKEIPHDFYKSEKYLYSFIAKSIKPIFEYLPKFLQRRIRGEDVKTN